MKKFFLISIILATMVACGYSQTYYYKAIANIDANGAKSKASGGMWITFMNKMGICYESDKDGYKANSYTMNFQFKNTQNGTHIYQCFYEFGGYVSWYPSYYYFNSDFTKMQYNSSAIKTEYERTNGPEEKYDPNIPTW